MDSIKIAAMYLMEEKDEKCNSEERIDTWRANCLFIDLIIREAQHWLLFAVGNL